MKSKLRTIEKILEKKYGVTLYINLDKDIYDYAYVEINDKLVKLGKKVLTDDGVDTKQLEDKIVAYLSKEKTYKNLRDFFEKAFNLKKMNMTIYPTTYGFGVSTVYNKDEKLLTKTFHKVLQENDIDYRVEYSNALHVYRFVISKSKKNIEKINNLKHN